MPKINVLPKSVAELIAAGEVVERPSSVVKELIENSVDAGAGRISVEIKNGGVRYIRVTDNGCGIAREDVPTAFISHATSKIKSGLDLNSIFTLGFRGEALPSVAAVSRLSMLTKTCAEEVGTLIEIEGGEQISLDDAGCPDGTTITVRDLFYNTPARMKFLKKDMTEGGYVGDVVTKIAVSHPEIAFSFVKDGKEIVSTPGNGDAYSAIYAIFGKNFADGMLKCEYELNSIKIKGYISRPLANRPNRNMQHFFVNGRYVRIPAAVPALDEAYKNSIMVGKFPSCFLFLDIDPEKTDVNVHPAKTEIRFSDERAIFEAVYYAAKSALNRSDTARPEIKLRHGGDILAGNIPQTKQLELNDIVIAPEKTAEKPVQKTENRIADSGRSPGNIQDAPVSSAFKDTSSVFNSINRTVPSSSSLLNGSAFSDGAEQTEKDSACEEISLPVQRAVPQPEKKYPAAYEKKPDIDIKADDIPAPGIKKAPEFKLIGEIFKTYIIVECDKKMLIIDKHAAHERLIFNRLKKKCGAEGSQLLLTPVSVSLSEKEYLAVLENISVFSDAGYAVDDFGDGTVIVRECPVELEKENIASLITEMAGELLRGNLMPVPEKLDWLYHSTACRAAVKAGSDLNPAEMEALVHELLCDSSVRYCPHGRPCIIEMSRYELEKQFGRLG